jgi:hypothetical protein
MTFYYLLRRTHTGTDSAIPANALMVGGVPLVIGGQYITVGG